MSQRELFVERITILSGLSILALFIMNACTGTRSRLHQVESLLETEPVVSDSILASMPEPQSHRDRAWYAVLKTQTDYKLYKPITSDSLILTATSYYGTHNKNYLTAMAWYSQGCVYSELNNDFAAIDAFLKAKDLFPDTLIRYYALTEKNLGIRYLNRMMLDEAIQQFRSCNVNANRLNDTKMSNYAFFHIGLCSLYSNNFIVAESIFREISENSTFSRSQKNAATIHLAKISLYYHENNFEALKLINRYLEMTKGLDYGTGLGVKAAVFFGMNEYDSAFYYYNESINNCDDIYSKCSAANKLSELSAIKGNTDNAIFYHKLYGELRDSINEIERSREIEELKYIHNEELAQETIAHKHKRITIVGISAVLTLSLLLFLAYSLFKSRERKRIMEKQEELLHQEEEIRRSSIKVLQARVSELSVKDQEARSALLLLYDSKLNICRNRFSNTDIFNKLLSFKHNSDSVNLNRKEKEVLFEQLQMSYVESMSDILAEIPDIKGNEIFTILLRHLDLNSNQIAELFSITPFAVKQRINRLSKRAPSDFLNLFSIRI